MPETLVSDNGPSLIAKDLETWLFNIGCQHLTSSEYSPRSNGLAERMVRSFKEHVRVNRVHDLRKTVDKFLMSYRNIPHSTTGITPAMMLLGRNVRTPSITLQSTGYYKLPLKKEYRRGDVVQHHGKMVELEDEDGHIVRRHESQVKAKVWTNDVDGKVGEEENHSQEEMVEQEVAEPEVLVGEPSEVKDVTVSSPTTACGLAQTRSKRTAKPVDRFIFS